MPIFAPVDESDVTKGIVGGFLREFEEYSEVDVMIIGGGPSGLIAGRDLANKGHKTLIVERMNYLGGGFWIGGYLMNKVTFRAPADEIVRDLGVDIEEVTPGLWVGDAPQACSSLIFAATKAGAKIRNMTYFDDLVMRENLVVGAVVNWTPVTKMPKEITCLDPIALRCRVLIDATGHDATVVRCLDKRGMVNMVGMGAMWVERSEDAIVEHTGEVFPGVVVTGMAVSETYGLPRMGPTFGGMLVSGVRAAVVAEEMLAAQDAEVAVAS